MDQIDTKLCCVLQTEATCSKYHRVLCEDCMNTECEVFEGLDPKREGECFCIQDDRRDIFECAPCLQKYA